MAASTHDDEVRSGQRFAFGANWRRFLRDVDEGRIRSAQDSLRNMLEVDALTERRFLDIGCGSGLFSLAARRLGARVRSFDFDPASVACTEDLRRRFYGDDEAWTVEPGSILDEAYVARLGQYDVVYSWGVLHHTGDMYRGFENACRLVAPRGRLFVAIYNDQRWLSRYWTAVKRTYNRGRLGRWAMIAVHTPYLFGARWLGRLLSGRLTLDRGMSIWHDMIDWLGGYPFEVARPEQVFSYFRRRGFVLDRLATCGGRMGCNEFVFTRVEA
jgi:SAM-dependent methyltransferase